LSGKEEIIAAMEQFEQLHEKYLPKVDRRLVIDLLLRLREKPDAKPMYTVETWIQPGEDTEDIRNQVIKRTGAAPAIYDNGTHLVAAHKVDYDLLKEIQDHPKVIEIKGTYTGSTASGASMESSRDTWKGEQ